MNNSLPPTATTAPAEPTRLGHYELLECIGRGGMGLVYRARDTRLDRQVAIKCLRTELFEAHYVERFKREALLLAKLNHPNIVQIYDFIEAPDQLALVMELVDGQNLQLHLREHIAPFAQRMRWLTEIAQGLAVAHDAGIIHRDLKAENILINQRKVAKITDLGIAKSQDFNATLTDHVAGSYCSMSPEQAMGEAIDFKSDLFSFGILAYQLLCGAHPFGDTNNKLQLMQRIISHPPIAPGKHNPNLPAEINDLLGQLLSKDPAKRPDNTHWVAAQFEKLSHLQLANDFVSDDTQAIIPNGSAANQSNVKHTGINRAVKTQDHPTFETRFVAFNTAPKKSRWLPIKNYLIENKISVSFGLFSALILAVVVIWQLQPKPPKYIAVIPPKLTAEGMQESQQELVKGAVYDAIQQSVIQLDGYYLIPRDEIADVHDDNEAVHQATAADELIATAIQCKIDVCRINLSWLVKDKESSRKRLRVKNSKTIDVVIDSYLSVASIIENQIEQVYSSKIQRISNQTSEASYSNFLNTTLEYYNNGADARLLDALDNMDEKSKALEATQTLYREIAQDLHHQNKDKKALANALKFIKENNTKTNSYSYLLNIYYIYLAQENYQEANAIEKKLKEVATSSISIAEIDAYKKMIEKKYLQAATLYQKIAEKKPTARNYFYTANAYWYTGQGDTALHFLSKSLELSPQHYESHSLKAIADLTSGRLAEAKTSLKVITMQNPNDIYNLGNLGICYLLLQDFSSAISVFYKGSSLEPSNTSILLGLADAYNLAGNKEKSFEIYKKIIEVLENKNDSSEKLRNLAQANAHLGRKNEALQTLSKFEKLDPQNPETFYTAAIVHTLLDSKASALFNIKNSLDNGIDKAWFKFSWFDKLCNENEFTSLIKSKGDMHRCIPPRI
jgi:serine/threonine protein kinase